MNLNTYNGSPIGAVNAKRREIARQLGAVAIIDTRYELEADRLPADLRQTLRTRNLRAIRIGSTTYRSSTWALVPAE